MALKLDTLRALKGRIPQAIDRGTARAAGMIRDLAVQLAPEDEGDLKATGRVEPAPGAGAGVYTIVFGDASGPNKFVDYAAYVEYGTADSPAQPFLTPAVHAVNLAAEIAKELREVLR